MLLIFVLTMKSKFHSQASIILPLPTLWVLSYVPFLLSLYALITLAICQHCQLAQFFPVLASLPCSFLFWEAHPTPST